MIRPSQFKFTEYLATYSITLDEYLAEYARVKKINDINMARYDRKHSVFWLKRQLEDANRSYILEGRTGQYRGSTGLRNVCVTLQNGQIARISFTKYCGTPDAYPEWINPFEHYWLTTSEEISQFLAENGWVLEVMRDKLLTKDDIERIQAEIQQIESEEYVEIPIEPIDERFAKMYENNRELVEVFEKAYRMYDAFYEPARSYAEFVLMLQRLHEVF
jgi:hypothetical protein